MRATCAGAPEWVSQTFCIVDGTYLQHLSRSSSLLTQRILQVLQPVFAFEWCLRGRWTTAAAKALDGTERRNFRVQDSSLCNLLALRFLVS
jgi:hypothetical protein